SGKSAPLKMRGVFFGDVTPAARSIARQSGQRVAAIIGLHSHHEGRNEEPLPKGLRKLTTISVRGPDRALQTLAQCSGHLLSSEPISTNRLVRKTRPAIWTHSETMLPTTWPHLLSTFIRKNKIVQAMPVTMIKIKSECRCRVFNHAGRFFPLTGRLSAEPTS